MKIPIIDIFAGPGGLGEGFSSLSVGKSTVFDIKLSIEKDVNAHRTLELRAFVRQFPKNSIPEAYYSLMQETNLAKRDELRAELFDAFPEEAKIAKDEAWLCELGSEQFPSSKVDSRIYAALDENPNWLLIGGPPCQAYSLVGRSRVGGIAEEDHRVYLYKEYLRIIAKHHPKVFVMENVKGLLSAKVNGENVFDWIKKDLSNPGSVFKNHNSPKYKVYSLSTPHQGFDDENNPIYSNDRDYLIQSELFGVPQKRHRVILLGVREDVDANPGTLEKGKEEITVSDVISDLPKIRSVIGRSIDKTGNKRYIQEEDNLEIWNKTMNDFLQKIIKWNGLSKNVKHMPLFEDDSLNSGSEFIEFPTPSRKNPLAKWYRDDLVKGAANHESRAHLKEDLLRYLFSSLYADAYDRFPRLEDFKKYSSILMPNHKSADTGKFNDRFRTQIKNTAATTVTSHISKDGHYFIHYDPSQCRSLTVREAARIQTFPDNYLFCGTRTAQFHQVGNAVPPYLAYQIAQIVSKIFTK